MWSSVIAVAGTLLGGALTALLQLRRERAGRDERRAEALRVALGELVAALGDHRRALWHREDLVLSGASPVAVDAGPGRDPCHPLRRDLPAGGGLRPRTGPRRAGPPGGPGRVRPPRRPAPTEPAARREAAITATDDLVDAAGRVTAR
ncbi:protein kilB [Streptomyces nogalater]|uniref:Protein kilB n=1 Tax=Streptomyces nogalater TaxID=38314 RepID=A0ABW0WW09_STRNO